MAYQIRLCRKDELPKLKCFLSRYWRSNHIFLNNQNLLDWQHLEGNNYNFVVANFEETDEFHGILGFISPEFFSQGKVVSSGHVWLAIWKVEKSLAVSKSIGIDLLNFIKDNYNPKNISAIGINKEVSFVYRLLGFRVGKLVQGFIINDSMENFNIAQIAKHNSSMIINETMIESEIEIKKIGDEELLSMNYSSMNADRFFGINYLNQRYINHPCYSYSFYIVRRNKTVLALFIARVVEVCKSRCLRIVDVWGLNNLDSNLCRQFKEILTQENFEYVDVVASPADFFKLENVGFRANTAESFVPHLFEPFVASSSEVMFATSSKDDISMFKADSDLDRPNFAATS
jgi:hypothetical protein